MSETQKNWLYVVVVVGDFRWVIVVSLFLAYGAYWVTRDNVSPPLIFPRATLLFVVGVFRLSFRKRDRVTIL